MIDWVTIDVRLKHVTQHQWLADAIEGFGRRPYIKPIDPGLGTESSHFTMKFQEPDFVQLVRIIAAIDRRYGLATTPIIAGMEVSVDFRPKSPSDDARARMVGVLFRHLAPASDIFSSPADTPRYAWGKKHRWARIQESRGSDQNDSYRFAVNDISNAPAADTTVYFGAENRNVMWRIMDKVLDRQNTFAGTYEALPAARQRCRVEVTLKHSKLAEMGIRHLEDVPRFKFSTLQGQYFQFKLATVSPRNLALGPVARYRERQRIQKFLATGISGLGKMDQTILVRDGAMRPLIRKELATRGKRIPGRPRTGEGPYGTAVAYEDLCKKVQTALRNLSRSLRSHEDE